jgi:RNA polymerase sigma factor (sigma-70 family)
MAQSGSTEELAKLAFERYRGGLQRYLMRRLDHAQNAQDLAQEVYLRLLRVDSADLVRQPQAYMYRIAAHVVYEFRLREEREKECLTIDSEALTELAERVADLSRNDVWRQMNTERELGRVLSQLPAIDQAIIVLQKCDGLSYAQVAQKLGISVHTVKKYLFRALLHLRSAAWDV